ncbi:hypothetical protein ACFTAO_09635 [Paenibacillus rhizoplanae]
MLPLSFGSHDLLVEAVCGGPGWGFRLEAAEAGNTSEVQVEAECSAALAEASPCCSPQGTLNKGAGASGVHGTVKLVSPYPVEGQTGTWLYLGPFLQSAAPQPAEAASMDAPFGDGAEECFLAGGPSWRRSQALSGECALRPLELSARGNPIWSAAYRSSSGRSSLYRIYQTTY